MPRIRKCSRAETDVLEIWCYMAQDNIDAADRVIAEFDARLKTIAQMPHSAESVDWIAEGVRRSTVGAYTIYYRPIEDGIEVIRVLHGARQPEDLL